MSGGVDSAVTAAVLKEQGYDVDAMMLRLWSEPGKESENKCCTLDSMALAQNLCDILDIPFYEIDAKEIFHDVVVNNFVDYYLIGMTPNPCLMCNRVVRWTFLLDHALELGATHMATGHYARVITNDDGIHELYKGIDPSKDQSYVLHVLTQDQLKHAMFPLGNYTKVQVRELAKKYQLPVATKTDSQDLCFTGDGDYQSFLQRNVSSAANPGNILNSQGDILGQHQGLAFYTIGQRRGLGFSSTEPYYVIEKNLEMNAIIVGTGDELYKSSLVADQFNWISGSSPEDQITADVKICYRSPYSRGEIIPHNGNTVTIKFDYPQRDITPCQAAVLYDKDKCLGGGIIQSASK